MPKKPQSARPTGAPTGGPATGSPANGAKRPTAASGAKKPAAKSSAAKSAGTKSSAATSAGAKRAGTTAATAAGSGGGKRFDRAGRESREQTAAERGNWLRGIRFSGFTVLMLAVIVLGVVVLAPNLKAYIEQRQQIAALQQAVDERSDEIDKLTAERQRWNDSTYVTTQARDRLYYANPGEISFIVIDDVDPALLGETSTPVSDTLEETDVDWGQALLGSVMSSGLADVATGTGSGATTPGGGSSPAPTP